MQPNPSLKLSPNGTPRWPARHAIEVSPELKIELRERLADFERDPEAGYSWDQVKAHLKSGSWRTA